MSALGELPLALTVEEAAKVLRIGRSSAYEAARRGELPTIRLGRMIRVPRHRLEAMLGSDNGHDLREGPVAEEAGDADAQQRE